MQLKFFVFLEQTCCCSCHSLRWMRSYSSERLVKLRAFMLSPPYSSSNKRSIGKRLHQWHKLIFLHDCHVILTSISFFLVFCRRILKTWLKKGEGGGNFSQSRERHSTRILLGSGDWCYARLLGRICHKSW